MVTTALAWVILSAPLAACVIIVLCAQNNRGAAAALAIGALGASLCATVTLLLQCARHGNGFSAESTLPWVTLPGLSLEFGFLLNPLSILMSLVVTGVGLMIFIYSSGYMHDDPALPRYFAFLSLFAFSMLGIVLANNFVTLFIFWELVGASSYLLIGFWYTRPQAADAGKKAFLVNRIADFGFLVGILMLLSVSGGTGDPPTLNFSELSFRLENLTAHGNFSPSILCLIGGLLFCGVLGKSAQFPLHVWLPDAMEGPTPVSALIHAATMVAAGVYMLSRVFFIFAGSPQLLEMIAFIGGFTSIFAASCALAENDIKRVLAYSTLSQLGYMVMALGLGGSTIGMYHLTTHAFFKALLFLGAGCVIHALSTNNIWEMGGLKKAMPVTTLTFFIASLALCGIFPLSGFWSKDQILSLAFEQNRFLWVVGTLTAGMTAFYMGRVLCVAFLGESRSTLHPHEAPRIMTIPLVVLALFSAIGGFLGIPEFIAGGEASHGEFHYTVAIVSSVVAALGLALAYAVYRKNLRPSEWLEELSSGPLALLRRKYFIDEGYSWVNRNIQQRLAIFLGLFERYVIIGLWVNGIAKVTGWTGSTLRKAQTGKVQGYALTLLVGLALLIYAGSQWVR